MWISTQRYLNISEHSHLVNPSFFATRIPLSDFDLLGPGVGLAVCELTTLTSHVQNPRRDLYHTRRCVHHSSRYVGQSTRCVSVPFYARPTEPIFVFRFCLVLFWYPDLAHSPLSDLLLEKLHRNHDLARIRAIGGSAQVSISFVLKTESNLTRPLLYSMPSFGGKQMQSLL